MGRSADDNTGCTRHSARPCLDHSTLQAPVCARVGSFLCAAPLVSSGDSARFGIFCDTRDAALAWRSPLVAQSSFDRDLPAACGGRLVCPPEPFGMDV